MKNIGVKKEIDKLGRICIPKEMRNLFKLYGEVGEAYGAPAFHE